MGHSNVWGPAGERLMVIGLTGGIAAGKTEVAGELVRLGACVVDADDIAREVILPGREAYLELLRQLGEHILDDSGRINRTALAEIVFSDAEKRQLVNEITHPAIIAEIVKRVTGYADKLGTDNTPAVVVDAALIVDIGASGVFDQILVVVADEETRIRRLVYRRGMSEGESRSRIASQVQDSKRVEIADFVIENNGTLEQLRNSVGDVWSRIVSRSRALYS